MDITPSITRRREAWKEKALDDLPWKDERGPSSVRRTLELFQRQRWEIAERRGGEYTIIGFSEWTDTVLNWTELNWKQFLSGNSQDHEYINIYWFTCQTYTPKAQSYSFYVSSSRGFQGNDKPHSYVYFHPTLEFCPWFYLINFINNFSFALFHNRYTPNTHIQERNSKR